MSGSPKGWGGLSADPRLEQILAVMAKETLIDPARLLPEATIEGLGIASIDLVQTIFELETRFDVEIPALSADSGSEFPTVGDLVKHVLATLDEAPPASGTDLRQSA